MTAAGVSAGQVDEVRELFIEALFAGNRGRRDPDKAERMMRIAKDFSAENIHDLIESLRRDSRLADPDEREQLIEACFEMIESIAPEALLTYLETHRDHPNWQRLFDSCNRRLLATSTKSAVERFEKETAKGNPDYMTTNQRQSLMFALAASDPDRMLSMAMSPELAADPDALAHLGGFVGNHLESPSDHLRFMAALRRAAEKQPDSELLATVRKDYVREMSGPLALWPIEQVRMLVDGEFSLEEKLLVAEKASHRGDLEDREKWADWFLKIDIEAWDHWIATQPQRFKHPVVTTVSEWGTTDPEAGAKWLETMPQSELRSQAVLEFAWAVADRDPARAAKYLPELPDSQGKRNLIKKIEKTGP